jgi:hypothetical protein
MAAVDNPVRLGAGVNRDIVEDACLATCSNDAISPSASSSGAIAQTPPKPAAEKTKGLTGLRHGGPFHLFTTRTTS